MIKLLLIVLLLTPYALVVTGNDLPLVQLDDMTSKGIPIIHEYILYTYGPK